MLPLHQRRVVALAQRVRDGGIFDRPAVQENDLLLPRRAAHARAAEQSGDAHARDFHLGHIEQFPHERRAEKIAQPLAQRLPRRELMHEAVVVQQCEADVRMPDRLKLQHMLDVAGLGVFRAQKFPPCRQVVEKRTRLDLRALGLAAVAHGLHFSAAHDHLRARERAVLACGEPEARHARDAGQRLAAEAERVDRHEVRARPDFARGVALEAEQRVVAIHAAAVVHDPDERIPAAPDQHLDARRAGIERIFHQLLHDARGPLDHLARGDLRSHIFGQQGDSAHLTWLAAVITVPDDAHAHRFSRQTSSESAPRK